MSSSGVYNRWINQYPGWHDGGDVMNQSIYEGNERLGYLQVETTHGNLWSSCELFYGPELRYRFRVYEYDGKKAIQNVLEYVRDHIAEIKKGLQNVPEGWREVD